MALLLLRVGWALMLAVAAVSGEKCSEIKHLKDVVLGGGPACWVAGTCDTAWAVDRSHGLFSVDITSDSFDKIAKADTDRPITMALKGTLAFVGDTSNIISFDITDRTNPQKLDTYKVVYGSSFQLSVDGDRLYVALANSNYGWEVVAISDPRNMQLLYRHKGDQPTLHVAPFPHHPNVIAVTRIGGVKFYDVSDLSDIKDKGVYAVNNNIISYSVSFSTDGQYMFISQMGDGIEIVKTSDWSKVAQVHTLQARYAHVFDSDGVMYVVDGTGGWAIFDISDITKPVIMRNVPVRKGGTTTALFVDDDLVVTSEASFTQDGPGGLAFYKVDCGITTAGGVEVTMIQGDKISIVDTESVAGRREMAGWEGPKGDVLLSNLPNPFLPATAFFPDQAGPLPAGTKFKLVCKDTGCGKPCEFYIALYHCPPCSGKINGKLPGLLPAAGWEARSCAPRFQLESGAPKERMVTYRRQLASGETHTTPETDTVLQHIAIFAVPDTVRCEAIFSENECNTDPACLWEDTKCILNWCPRPKPGPTPPPCVCF